MTVATRAQFRWAYFYEPWHYVDIALLVVQYTVMALRMASFLILSEFDFDSLTSRHVDLYPLGFVAIQVRFVVPFQPCSPQRTQR